MSKSLKVIALISGGKDSIFSILQCIANGHEVIALANLHPPIQDGVAQEDIDSYMYQTIGHNIVPLYEDALGIPLYRETITGSAIDTSKTYQNMQDTGDETENLAALLERVKRDHPEANAVCSGAILSSYQRTRLETVALRLKLAPLAFLWQYPVLPPAGDTALLHDMAAIGVDARIVKTASEGLEEPHLWLNVASADGILKLRQAMSRFGEPDPGALLGEGGEFETITIDGPAPLWKKAIEVEYEAVPGSGGTAFLRCKNAWLKERTASTNRLPRAPELLDPNMNQVLSMLRDHQASAARATAIVRADPWIVTQPSPNVELSILESDHTICISNITSTKSPDISDQLKAITGDLSSELKARALDFDDILQTTVILRKMSDFVILNKAYESLFQKPNPPSRVTFAADECLANGVQVVLSTTVSRLGRSQRQGLHVQSQSYWAPANIGPYSQAITSPLPAKEDDIVKSSSLVYIAGQIPLVPASMVLCQSDFAEQAVLALQHLNRIGRASNVHCWISAVGLITAKDSREAHERAQIAMSAWNKANEIQSKEDDEDLKGGDDDYDIGDAYLRRPRIGTPQALGGESLGQVSQRIPDRTRVEIDQKFDEGALTPCLVAQVAELPRGATIEWLSQGLSLGIHAGGTPAKAVLREDLQTSHLSDPLSRVHFGCVSIRKDMARIDLRDYYEDLERANCLLQLEAYVTSNTSEQDVTWAQRLGAKIIPCKALWGSSGASSTAFRWWAVHGADNTEE